METQNKIFVAMISQPIDNNHFAAMKYDRNKAKQFLESTGWVVKNTFFKDSKKSKEAKHSEIFYLSKSIKEMADVDMIYFLKGWENSPECKIEHEIAKQYGIKIQYEE